MYQDITYWRSAKNKRMGRIFAFIKKSAVIISDISGKQRTNYSIIISQTRMGEYSVSAHNVYHYPPIILGEVKILFFCV